MVGFIRALFGASFRGAAALGLTCQEVLAVRIGNSTIAADLVVQHNLARALAQLNESGMRLSTMRRINRGSDDPAGLIAAAELEAELADLEATHRSAGRMTGAVQVADSAMAQVGDLLNVIRGHVVEAAGGGLSEAELQAKQIEVDAALQAINSLGNSTTFGGQKLLDGTYTLDLSSLGGGGAAVTLPEISTGALGGSGGILADLASGGSASLASGNLTQAAEILDAAQTQVLQARTEAGAFQRYTIESTQRVLEDTQENLSSALSQIRDTDVAAETSRQVRSRLLADAAMAALALVRQGGSGVLNLLGRNA